MIPDVHRAPPTEVQTLATAHLHLRNSDINTIWAAYGHVDILVTTYGDGTGHIAWRTGRDNTSKAWSAPVELEVAQ